MARRLFVLISLAIALFVTACGNSGQAQVEPPAPLPTPTLPPQLGSLVHVGEPIARQLPQTTEVVHNCGGGSEPIVKHPSLGTVSANSVEWEVGGQFGVGLSVGRPYVPVDVNLSGVLEVADRTQLEHSLQQGVSWDLPAASGEVMTFILSWEELWQRAYLDVTFSAQTVHRINFNYRTSIRSNLVSSYRQDCESDRPTGSTSILPISGNAPTPSATQSLYDGTSVIPELVFIGRENGVQDYAGQSFTRYSLSIMNWTSFPKELFEAAPDLPPCGLNNNASRTWVEIYDNMDNQIYGFCGLGSPQDLTLLWFGVGDGESAPTMVYVTLNDRRKNIVYRSNDVEIIP